MLTPGFHAQAAPQGTRTAPPDLSPEVGHSDRGLEGPFRPKSQSYDFEACGIWTPSDPCTCGDWQAHREALVRDLDLSLLRPVPEQVEGTKRINKRLRSR